MADASRPTLSRLNAVRWWVASPARFGPAPDAEELTRIDRHWSKLVEISHNPHVDPARAGVPTGGMVLILPDSHIGFRFPSANAEALTTLDRHLSSYLVPDPVCA